MKATSKIVLGSSAKSAVHNTDKLQKQAEAVASNLIVPAGVEFARFDHAGKQFALSARLVIEVELLEHRVPDVVIRQGQLKRPQSVRKRGI